VSNLLKHQMCVHINSDSFLRPALLRHDISYPLEVRLVALVNRQADDLSHLVRMVGAEKENNRSEWSTSREDINISPIKLHSDCMCGGC